MCALVPIKKPFATAKRFLTLSACYPTASGRPSGSWGVPLPVSSGDCMPPGGYRVPLMFFSGAGQFRDGTLAMSDASWRSLLSGARVRWSANLPWTQFPLLLL